MPTFYANYYTGDYTVYDRTDFVDAQSNDGRVLRAHHVIRAENIEEATTIANEESAPVEGDIKGPLSDKVIVLGHESSINHPLSIRQQMADLKLNFNERATIEAAWKRYTGHTLAIPVAMPMPVAASPAPKS